MSIELIKCGYCGEEGNIEEIESHICEDEDVE